MKKVITIGFILTLLLLVSWNMQAQTKKPRKTPVSSPAVIAPTPEPDPTPPADPAKRNERPSVPGVPMVVTRKDNPVFLYEFTRPGFVYEKIVIEHNEAGIGTISFLKEGFEEMLTDPVNLSATTLSKVNAALDALRYLDSTEDYQYEKDFSNMGNVTFKLERDGRERTVKYNWTENKNAKILMDEYRRIGSEYTWRFEISIARENQPLQTPGLMDALDSYMQRNEISDPVHMLPFLNELSNDERMPLMARNRASKLIKQIEKAKK